ncbi:MULTISPECIES: hypothetical protein [Burkholderia]|nr:MULTISPECIES: hypothetical protein [Burkholderia]MCW5191769.1 hypothetical protein [Burkholderia cenocepacia]
MRPASPTCPPRRWIQREDIARLVANTIALPNQASIAERPINCRHEDLF